jgi:chromosome segregation ATPase
MSFVSVLDENLALLKDELADLQKQTNANTADIAELKEFRSRITAEVVEAREEIRETDGKVAELVKRVNALTQWRLKQFAGAFSFSVILIYVIHFLVS